MDRADGTRAILVPHSAVSLFHDIPLYDPVLWHGANFKSSKKPCTDQYRGAHDNPRRAILFCTWWEDRRRLLVLYWRAIADLVGEANNHRRSRVDRSCRKYP